MILCSVVIDLEERPQRVELRFLTPEVIVGASVPGDRTIERARSDIRRAAEGIRAKRFPGDPSYEACQYCPYSGICPDKVL